MRSTLVEGETSPHPSAAIRRTLELLGEAEQDPSIERIVHCYRPAAGVALTRRESLKSGYPAAAAAAEQRGFAPVIRPTGGRAAAFNSTCLVLDVIDRRRSPTLDPAEAFSAGGLSIVGVMRRFGIDARLGGVPGEYCPGQHSVNARGAVKLAGTAQRLTKRAQLFSALIPLGDVDAIREVLIAVNRRLGLDWDPRTLGSPASEISGIDAAALGLELVRAFAPDAAPSAIGPHGSGIWRYRADQER